jgi:hypothetical protein
LKELQLDITFVLESKECQYQPSYMTDMMLYENTSGAL